MYSDTNITHTIGTYRWKIGNAYTSYLGNYGCLFCHSIVHCHNIIETSFMCLWVVWLHFAHYAVNSFWFLLSSISAFCGRKTYETNFKVRHGRISLGPRHRQSKDCRPTSNQFWVHRVAYKNLYKTAQRVQLNTFFSGKSKNYTISFLLLATVWTELGSYTDHILQFTSCLQCQHALQSEDLSISECKPNSFFLTQKCRHHSPMELRQLQYRQLWVCKL